MNHVDIAHYANDNTPYVYGKNIDILTKLLDFEKNLHMLSSNDLVTISFKQMPANVMCY